MDESDKNFFGFLLALALVLTGSPMLGLLVFILVVA
jgi:hypothetical protein